MQVSSDYTLQLYIVVEKQGDKNNVSAATVHVDLCQTLIVHVWHSEPIHRKWRGNVGTTVNNTETGS